MISILIPTRKRPEQLRAVINSARMHSIIMPEIVCYVDDDDASYSWLEGRPADLLPVVKILRGPRIVLSNYWNKCAAVAKGDILMQGNDDILFRTHGWDSLVEETFAGVQDKILMVHGSDGSQGAASSTGGFGPHPFVHRKWVDTLGYFTPPYFSSDFGDSWINELANAIGRRRYLPFIVEHMHFIFGKAEVDETTRDRLARHSNDKVEQLYRDMAPLRQIDISKLKVAMQ